MTKSLPTETKIVSLVGAQATECKHTPEEERKKKRKREPFSERQNKKEEKKGDKSSNQVEVECYGAFLPVTKLSKHHLLQQ
jgi:hypothetical protein